MKIKIKLKNKKDKLIQGELSKNNKQKSIVVFLGGFSGDMNSLLFNEASRFFMDNSYDTLRFNFCNTKKTKHQKTLKIEEMNLGLYTITLKEITNYLLKNYLKIILIGHSFGAVISALLLSKYPKYKKSVNIVFWDPAILPWKRKWMEEDFTFLREKGMYTENISGNRISKRFYEELIRTRDISNLVGGLKKNILIVSATEIGTKNGKRYCSKISKGKSKLVVIKGADHNFSRKSYRKKLFNETLNFLNSSDITRVATRGKPLREASPRLNLMDFVS